MPGYEECRNPLDNGVRRCDRRLSPAAAVRRKNVLEPFQQASCTKPPKLAQIAVLGPKRTLLAGHFDAIRDHRSGRQGVGETSRAACELRQHRLQSTVESPFAIVGLCQIREKHIFGGLPISTRASSRIHRIRAEFSRLRVIALVPRSMLALPQPPVSEAIFGIAIEVSVSCRTFSAPACQSAERRFGCSANNYPDSGIWGFQKTGIWIVANRCLVQPACQRCRGASIRFQSTRPVRAATIADISRRTRRIVSIHAARAGRDAGGIP